MGTLAEQLLEDFNDYRRKTGHAKALKTQGKFAPRVSRKQLPKFEALAHWCRDHKVDPRRWLASLFHSRRWMFPPKLNQLQSQKHLQRYAKMDTIPAFHARVQVENQTAAYQEGRVFVVSRDLSNSAEMLKRRHTMTGNSVRCMDQMETETFGYHPKSTVCQQCSARYQCASILQTKVKFDILALRAGHKTHEEIQMEAYNACK
jgi:hypothetical protein